MKLENDYPILYKKVNLFLKLRKIYLITSVIAFISCIIVNLSIGGKLWFLYVLGGEMIFYYAFFNRPLIDNILLKRISIVLIIIIGYLYLIDIINTTNWSILVIDILCFSLLVLQILFFFINYKQYKNKIIIMFFTSLISIILCFLGIVNVISINWALIVTGSLGLLVLMVLLTFYFKMTLLELIKYFSVK